MLDNTAVVLFDMFGNGSTHDVRGGPFVIIGSCGGYFKTGQYLKFGDFGPATKEANRRYTPHNGLLVSLCNAMQAPRETFGEPVYGGELPGIKA